MPDKLGPIQRAVQGALPSQRSKLLHWLTWRAYGTEIFATIEGDGHEEWVGTMVSEVVATEAAMAHNTTLRYVDV